MKKLRRYGEPPFTVAVIHGGPGAPGYMAPVARELSANWGVLEPLQTATSLEGQVQELRTVLEEHGRLPVTLIGSSWGAILSYILAARSPDCVRKLILIGSAVYEEQYATNINEIRRSRLSDEEKTELHSVMLLLGDPACVDKNDALVREAALFTKADSYKPLTLDTEVIEHQYDLHLSVWKDAKELRKSGELLRLGRQIRCPVVAIHGAYDPHPAEGVQKPLSTVLKDFRFILLEKCGHLLWIEKYARDEFYRILKAEVRSAASLGP
jgi:pimeloyl-ACP methyl ester carboxylesterase